MTMTRGKTLGGVKFQGPFWVSCTRGVVYTVVCSRCWVYCDVSVSSCTGWIYCARPWASPALTQFLVPYLCLVWMCRAFSCLPHPAQAGWMSGFAYVIMHSSLCPEKLASDLINQDKQSVFSYSPSLEEGVQVLKYAFECLTSDSCSGCSCFPTSSSGDITPVGVGRQIQGC